MKKILVVDDEPEIIELVESRLSVNNYQVISAMDGNEGIKKAEKESPDLILMDVMMPKMSGGDALRILKANEKTKDIPVVFLTGVKSNKEPTGEEDKGINVGGQYYPAVGKPFESEKLLLAIEKNLS